MDTTIILIISILGSYYGIGILYLCCRNYFRSSNSVRYMYLENVEG